MGKFLLAKIKHYRHVILGNLKKVYYKDQKKVPEVCIYMDGLLLRANRTIKVSNRVHHPFKSPKYPALAYKTPNGLFDYRLDHVLRPKEHLPTSFQDKEINASIGIIHLFPSLPISQVEAQLNDSNVQGIVIIGKFKGQYRLLSPGIQNQKHFILK